MGWSNSTQKPVPLLIKVFSIYGIPQVVHSDQGRNFESTLLRQTLEAFGINKSRQGDGMVEFFNNLIFGFTPAPFAIAVAYDPVSYQVPKGPQFKANLVQAASQQQVYYNGHSYQRQFKVGDAVWLSIPTAGKVDPKWEGGWIVMKVESLITMKVQKGDTRHVVHVNSTTYSSCQY